MPEIDTLLVDDTPANVTLLAFLLKKNGHAVRTAYSAAEARTLIAQRVPSVLIVDVQMPGTDGLTFTRELRANAPTSDIVIVAVTAFAMKGDDERAYEAGCDGYITKPIDTRTFMADLSAAIARRKVGGSAT
jgi:two-component system cell cycle response regulator